MTNCSKSCVGNVIKKCEACKRDYEAAKELHKIIYGGNEKTKLDNEIDWATVHERITKDKSKVNLQYIWYEEYRPTHPDGLSYSHFCRKYREWKTKNIKEVTMVQSRVPGKELYIDWVGDTLACVIDQNTGIVTNAHFFITTLGVSSYPYVEVFPNEGEINWIQWHINAFKWYGGIPFTLVPDNCKTAVTQSDLYEPTINNSYIALVLHYGVGIISARVRKTRDKGCVESSVRWVETWLLE